MEILVIKHYCGTGKTEPNAHIDEFEAPEDTSDRNLCAQIKHRFTEFDNENVIAYLSLKYVGGGNYVVITND